MSEPTVLVVEDEKAIRDMLRMALEVAKYRFIEAENIRDAHVLIVDERPDIVLLDWMLPGGSGLELLRRLKREDNTREIPVIMLTALASGNVAGGASKDGVLYLAKPVEMKRLLHCIEEHVKAHSGKLLTPERDGGGDQ